MAAARLYPAHTVGLQTVAVNSMIYVSSVSQLNLMGFYSRFLAGATPALATRLIRTGYAVTTTLSVVGAVVFVVIARNASGHLLPAGAGFDILFGVGVVCYTVFNLQDAAITGLRAAHWVPVENLGFSLVKLALIVVLAFSPHGSGIFASWVIGAAVTLVPVNWLIFRRLVPTRPAGGSQHLDVGSAARFIAPDYLGAVLSQAATSLLPVLVVSQVGATSGAYFSLVWMVAMAVDLVGYNLATSYTVEASHDGRSAAQFLSGTARHLLAWLVPVSVVLVAGAPLLLRVFGPAYSAHGTTVLRLVGLAVVPRAFVNLSIGVARVRRRMSWAVLVNGVTLAAALAGALCVPSRDAATGAALAWLIAEWVLFVLCLPVLRRPIGPGAVAVAR